MLAFPASLREAIDAGGGSGLTILVLRLGAMGDIVRTLPAVRLVRRGLPECSIHWVSWQPWDRILEGQGDLNGVIALPRSELRALARSPFGWPSLVRGVSRIGAKVRALGSGLVLDFHGDFRTGLIGWASGAAVRLGYDGHQQKEGNRFFTTQRVPSGDRRTPRLLRNLALVRALGLPDRPVPDAGIAVGPADAATAHEIVRALVGSGGAYAVLNPGASRRQAYKKPPAPLFGAAARALAEHGIASIVASGPGEEDDVDRVVGAAGGMARRAPATSLKALAALLSGARLFVGGDSGPLHLACGVGCPVVGLYGPTDPVVNTPWNVPFVALTRPGSAHTGVKSRDREVEGFDGLTPEAVARAIDELLGRTRDRSGVELV
jgi:ADP-heptose:LPS heptosyltransferase